MFCRVFFYLCNAYFFSLKVNLFYFEKDLIVKYQYLSYIVTFKNNSYHQKTIPRGHDWNENQSEWKTSKPFFVRKVPWEPFSVSCKPFSVSGKAWSVSCKPFCEREPSVHRAFDVVVHFMVCICFYTTFFNGFQIKIHLFSVVF